MTTKSPRGARWLGTALAGSLIVGATLGAGTLSPAVAADTAGITITPNPSYLGPEFEGWGTSLVWFANATGGYPDDVRQDLFDKVFGDAGLNLNIARYNVGGGNASDVPSYLRPGGAVEGWWNPDAGLSDAAGPITSNYADRERYAAAWDASNPEHYNFEADKTQRWWVEALKDKITKWEAFSNSPPYFLTESGFTSGGINSGTSEQLSEKNIDDFSTYMKTVVQAIEADTGISFDTIDPFNEPNTNYWSTQLGANGWPTSASRQEGAHIGPEVQDEVIKSLAAELAKPGTTTDAAISAMDETNPSTFAKNWNTWSSESKALVDQLNVHTYGTGGRLVARDIAKTAGKPLWMSEVGGDWDGTGYNLTNMDNGLGLASHIIDDMRELEPSAWVLWQPVEDTYNMEKVEKLNWGSVFVDFDCNADGDSLRRLADGETDPSCKVETNAKYNTMRNFTNFIRPGDHFIPSDNTQTASAVTADGQGARLVHANSADSARQITIDLSKFGAIAENATVTPVTTTESPADNPTLNGIIPGTAVKVSAVSKSATLTVPANSVTTFVVDGVSGVAKDAAVVKDGSNFQLIGQQSKKALTSSGTTDVVPGALINTVTTTGAGAVNQRWTATVLGGDASNNQRIMLSDSSGNALAASSAGTTLVKATKDQALDQEQLQWIPTTTDGRNYSLVNVATASALEVPGQATAEGSPVSVYQSNNGSNQLWTLRSTEVSGIEPVAVQTLPGHAPSLPSEVTPLYGTTSGTPVPVAWDLTGLDWKAGTVQVQGAAMDGFGQSIPAVTALVEIGAYAATDPTSVTVAAGTTLASAKAAAPATVSAQVDSGSSRFSTPVVWDWAGVTDEDLASTGVITVAGKADSNDPSADMLDAKLSVIVTPAVYNNVAPSSTPSATFTESSSYAVGRTINGVYNEKAWSNWKSSGKNEQDTLSYVLATTSLVNGTTIQFYKDGGSSSWAKSLVVEYKDPATGDWLEAAASSDIPAEGSAPTVELTFPAVLTDQIRVVLNAHDNTHMVVSEVEIFAAQAAPSSISSLARLSAAGVDIPGFDPEKREYSVSVPAGTLPLVSAIPTDRNAVLDIKQATDASPSAVVTVTAPDGTTASYSVDFVVEAPPTASPSASPTPGGSAGPTPGASAGPEATPTPSATTGGPANPTELPNTGTQSRILLGVAMSVLLGGVALIVLRRRRV